MPISPYDAARIIVEQTPLACEELNRFTAEVFQTRGGRIGSGMGGVIEALWGFYLNRRLVASGIRDIEIAWMYGHEYNDFACVNSSDNWDPSTKQGEILRIEAKSMVAAADESKAHFDRLRNELDPSELLAVFLWEWAPVDGNVNKFFPRIKDQFVGSAVAIAELRDALHTNRGGTFVSATTCPDRCVPANCPHVGEPLNAKGVRERRSGPTNAKARSVSYAANFGGLLRMLGSRGRDGQTIITQHRRANPDAASFVAFMARNFPKIKHRLQDL